MAKFRRNHQRSDKSGFSSLLIRVFMFFALATLGFIYLYRMLNADDDIKKDYYNDSTEIDTQAKANDNLNFCPFRGMDNSCIMITILYLIMKSMSKQIG